MNRNHYINFSGKAQHLHLSVSLFPGAHDSTSKVWVSQSWKKRHSKADVGFTGTPEFVNLICAKSEYSNPKPPTFAVFLQLLLSLTQGSPKLTSQYGGFLKWWYPTTMGFPTKNDHFGV